MSFVLPCLFFVSLSKLSLSLHPSLSLLAPFFPFSLIGHNTKRSETLRNELCLFCCFQFYSANVTAVLSITCPFLRVCACACVCVNNGCTSVQALFFVCFLVEHILFLRGYITGSSGGVCLPKMKAVFVNRPQQKHRKKEENSALLLGRIRLLFTTAAKEEVRA